MMRLYFYPASTGCRPILLFCAEAKLELETHLVDLAKGEQQGAAYRAINPSGLVPVLVDGDFALTESSAILKYLADSVGSPLYPTDRRARARVNERMDWFNTGFHRDYIVNFVYTQLMPHYRRGSEQVDAATIAWGREKVVGTWLPLLDQHLLGEQPFLCGEAMTIADVFGAEIVAIGGLVGARIEGFPSVSRWMERMRALPSWAAINAAFERPASPELVLRPLT